MLQLSAFSSWPTQSRPPWLGEGLSHPLLRVMVPDPQLLVQLVQSVQPPHSPSTAMSIVKVLHDACVAVGSTYEIVFPCYCYCYCYCYFCSLLLLYGAFAAAVVTCGILIDNLCCIEPVRFSGKCPSLPAHVSLEQSCTSVSSPMQSSPPNSGVGLLQARIRVCVPVPQEAEHWPQLVQSPHSPSTASGREH